MCVSREKLSPYGLDVKEPQINKRSNAGAKPPPATRNCEAMTRLQAGDQPEQLVRRSFTHST